MFCPEQQVLNKWYKRVGLEPVENKGKMKAIPARRFGKTPQKKPLSFKEEKRLHKGYSTRIARMFHDRAASLRWHYPVQVLRVAGCLNLIRLSAKPPLATRGSIVPQ
jgi:hypothetical protein